MEGDALGTEQTNAGDVESSNALDEIAPGSGDHVERDNTDPDVLMTECDEEAEAEVDFGDGAEKVEVGDGAEEVEVGDGAGEVEDGSEQAEEPMTQQNLVDVADEVEVIPEPVETEEEQRNRIKEFYNSEFARPDLENSTKTSYTVIRYEQYHRSAEYNNAQKPSHKKKVELNEGNAKIAEYFGEDLNSDEEFDQLIKQFTDANITDASPDVTDEREGSIPADGNVNSVCGVLEQNFVNGLRQPNSVERLGMKENTLLSSTIIEEKENEFEMDETRTKQKEKPKVDRKKKNFDITSTKVHIRHLPKNMKKEEFLNAMGPLPEYNYLHFTSGLFMSRVCSRRCTGFCHINFVNQEDADAFVSNYRLFIIRDDKGDETLGSVEFAINQRIPKSRNPTISPDALYDMQKDPKFLEFKSNYEVASGNIIGVPVNPDGSVTADVMMNEIEERNQHKSELQTTPLLSYILGQAKNEKEKKFGNALKKASEKTRITIKKEPKRDRRDRRDRKEKDKDKVKILRNSADEKVDTKEGIKHSNKRSKQQRGGKSDKADSGIKNRSVEISKDGDGRSATSNKCEAGDRKGGSGREKVDDKNKKLQLPSKKGDKKSQDKRYSGNRGSKTEAPPANSKTDDVGKKSEETQRASNSEVSKSNDDPSGTDQEKSQGGSKKKTVKRVVKIKKVVKLKADESGNSAVIAELKEAGSLKSPENSHGKGSSKSADHQSSNKGEKSCMNKESKEDAPSNGAESKRTKKARPDIQIYRPGSLRSNKLGDGGKNPGDLASKKDKSDTAPQKGGSNRNKPVDPQKQSGS